MSDQSQTNAILGAPATEDGVLLQQSQAMDSRWTILIYKIDSTRPEIDEQTLAALRNRFPAMYLMDREGTRFLAHGQYTSPESSQAKNDLNRIHAFKTTFKGVQVYPYSGAFLAPPSAEDLKGANPEYDLRNVRKRFGENALYTLQIAIYGRNDRNAPTSKDLAEFRQTAEMAVQNLRRNGEQAFYYHAPIRSTVTIGVFYEKDHDPSTFPRYESPRLKDAREKHPLNLLNGQGVSQIVRDERGRATRKPQASFLVAIPKK